MSDLRERIVAGDLTFLDGVGLLAALASQRWFGAKSRDVLDARVVAATTSPGGSPLLSLAIVEVRFGLQTHELYQLALGFRPVEEGWKDAVVAEVGGWTAYDALVDPQLARELVGLMRRSASLPLQDANVSFHAVGTANAGSGELTRARPMGVEQSNTSVVLDDRLVLKLYRRLEAGTNPELELLRFLTERSFSNIAALEGWSEMEGRPLDATLAILQHFVRARGDGWTLALETLEAEPGWLPARAGRLGEVTASMHTTLASDSSDPSFAPEEPSSESLALLSASIDEEIEQVFLHLPESGIRRPDRGPRRGGARPAAAAVEHRAGRACHPSSRGLPPRPGALERRRRLDRAGLRGRAGSFAARASAQALAAAGMWRACCGRSPTFRRPRRFCAERRRRTAGRSAAVRRSSTAT